MKKLVDCNVRHDEHLGTLHFSNEFAVIFSLLIFLLLCNLLLNAFQSGIFVDV